MFHTVTTSTQDPKGTQTTRSLGGAIVESTCEGVVTKALVQSVLDTVPSILAVPRVRWLVDLTGVVESNLDAREPGSLIFARFKEHGGGGLIAMVVKLPLLRMVIRTAAFGAGLPIKVFEAREDALAYLRTRDAAA